MYEQHSARDIRPYFHTEQDNELTEDKNTLLTEPWSNC